MRRRPEDFDRQITEGVAELRAVLNPELAESYRKIADQILHERGNTRIVKQVRSLIQQQSDKGKLEPHLLNAADRFAAKMAGAMGVATEDWHHSTHQLIGAYDGMPVQAGSFGPRTPGLHRLECGTYIQRVFNAFPKTMLPDFMAFMEQHVQYRSEANLRLARRLRDLGSDRGFDGKRADSAAIAIIQDMLLILEKAMDDIDNQIARERQNNQRRKAVGAP